MLTFNWVLFWEQVKAFYEPDWRSGKAIATRIAHESGEPMGVAGLWTQWHDSATGQNVYSFTMLTINADHHPFMRNFHKPEDEKRMIVILPRSRYDEWLDTSINRRIEFLKSFDEMDLRWIPK